MNRRVFFQPLLTVCVTICLSRAQECVPTGVLNLTLLSNGTLSWAVSPQESCEVTHFTVNVYRPDEGNLNIEVSETSLDVTFLPFCESWVFTVRAVAVDTSSLGHILIAKIPLPADADMALSRLEVVHVDDDLRLVWKLEDDKFKSCADSYRVTVSDYQSGYFTDVYVTDKSLNLDFASPCVTYEFGVRVINNGRPTEEGPLKSIEYDVAPVKQNPPRLVHVSLGSTSANTTWVLDTLNQNRCPIRSMQVDGGQHFNISIPVRDSDEREPVAINLSSLRPNSLYLLKVSVENSGGFSNRTMVGVQTLDLEPGAS